MFGLPCLSPQKPLPVEFQIAFMVLVGSEAEVRACDKHLPSRSRLGPRQLGACVGEFGAETKRRAAGRITSHLKAQMNSYKTTADEDRALLASAKSSGGGGMFDMSLTEHEKLAIRYRLSRKDLLSLLLVDQGRRLAANDPSLATSSETGTRAASSSSPSDGSPLPTDLPLREKVDAFNAWFNGFSPRTNYITAAPVPGMRIGTLTTRKIVKEEVYLEVPVAAIMNSATARADDVLGPVYESLAKKHPRGDRFHELLFHLMYEYFVRGTSSKWAPYLDVIPSTSEIVAPGLTWSDAELDELKGSDILPSLRSYKERVRRRYAGVKKHVMDQYPHVFDESAFSEENYG